MIDDIIKSVKVSLYDRVTSPLFGAFFISWCGWNYKTVLIIFSSLEVKEKFQLIETIIYPTTWSLALSGLGFPLLTAVIFFAGISISSEMDLWLLAYCSKEIEENKTKN